MILNVIDRRSREYRWKSVDAVIEDTWHDNSVSDADHVDETEPAVGYYSMKLVSLQEAIAWASKHEAGVTLFLYDGGSGQIG